MRMITQEAVKKAFADALDKRARAAPNLSEWKYQAAEACGVDISTIERTLYGQTCPEASLAANLCEHYGPDFKNEVEALGSYVSARRADAEQIVSANSIKDLRKLAPVLRAAADEIDEHAGKLRPKEVA